MDVVISIAPILIAAYLIYFLFKFIDRKVCGNFLIWLGVLIVFNIFDAITTHVIMKRFGIEAEANPILRLVALYVGPFFALVVYKFTLVMLGSFILFLFKKYEAARKTVIALSAVFVAVVINNCLIIYLLPV